MHTHTKKILFMFMLFIYVLFILLILPVVLFDMIIISNKNDSIEMFSKSINRL